MIVPVPEPLALFATIVLPAPLAWRERRHTEAWGFQSFRVLTITPSEKRIDNMIAAQRAITNTAAAGLFLYTTPDRLAASGAFGDAWVNGAGEPVRLLA